jgi:hypothetical protein
MWGIEQFAELAVLGILPERNFEKTAPIILPHSDGIV